MLPWCGLAHVVLHSQTHNTHLTLDSCGLQLGKLSPSALRGVPPNLIVTFPYRTRWHLVDFFSPIILSGKWLFLISHVMVYGNSEGPGEGNVWGGTVWNISGPTVVSAPVSASQSLFSWTLVWLFHISVFDSFPDGLWMTGNNVSCVVFKDGSVWGCDKYICLWFV